MELHDDEWVAKANQHSARLRVNSRMMDPALDDTSRSGMEDTVRGLLKSLNALKQPPIPVMSGDGYAVYRIVCGPIQLLLATRQEELGLHIKLILLDGKDREPSEFVSRYEDIDDARIARSASHRLRLAEPYMERMLMRSAALDHVELPLGSC